MVAALSLTLLSAVSGVQEVPDVLIIQQYVAGPAQQDLEFKSEMADELDQDGRVRPITWSLSDPVFRAKLDDGTLGGYVSRPTDDQIKAAAQKLRVDYIFIIQAVLDQNAESVMPQAFLYKGRGSRSIWKYEQKSGKTSGKITVSEDGAINSAETKRLQDKFSKDLLQGAKGMVVKVNGVIDRESTTRSLARTFTALLAEGPFKRYPPRARNFTPDATGSLVFEPDMTAFNLEPQPVQEAIDLANRKLETGNVRDAILTLRDSIDGHPISPTPRSMLVQILLTNGKTRAAAREAERASKLIPGSVDLWLTAAQAHSFLGNVEQAKSCLMEAQARGAASPQSFEIAGNVSLLAGDYESAQKMFSEAIVKGHHDAYLGRALTFALMGNTDRCNEELAAYSVGSISHPKQRYQMVLSVIEPIVSEISATIRDCTALIRVEDSSEVKERVVGAAQKTMGLVSFIENLPVPEIHQESHQTRNLAHKLLAQSASELLAFSEDDNESAAMESTISLSEATRFFEVANTAYNAERTH